MTAFKIVPRVPTLSSAPLFRMDLDAYLASIMSLDDEGVQVLLGGAHPKGYRRREDLNGADVLKTDRGVRVEVERVIACG